MKNKKGEHGRINKSGLCGDSSYLIEDTDPEFYSYIEEGILSTVRTLIEHGYHTVSSCQGHPDHCANRCVSVIAEMQTVQQLSAFVCSMNVTVNPVDVFTAA